MALLHTVNHAAIVSPVWFRLCRLRAFVVGYEIAPKTSRDKEIKEDGVLRGKVMATTYGQLTRSAHQRLFRLKERIPARYEDVSGADLSARVMQMASQAPLVLAT
jgi:hypothetical protein